jgi:hypothetical protein
MGAKRSTTTFLGGGGNGLPGIVTKTGLKLKK